MSDADKMTALQAERDSFWQANLRLVAERERALTRVAELEAALPRAYEMGRDDAASAADYMGAIQDQRDGSYAGSVAVMGRDVGDIIRALPTPADLAERISAAQSKIGGE